MALMTERNFFKLGQGGIGKIFWGTDLTFHNSVLTQN